MTDRVVVVGGGLVGLSCAWFLRAEGLDVTVLEASARLGAGASRGNAGAICPSMVEPLPAPGMIREALSDLPRSDAALHVHPAYAPRMAGFLRRFAAAATTDGFERGLRAMVQLGKGAAGAFEAIAAAGIDVGSRGAGYVFVHRGTDPAAREREHLMRMHGLGVCAAPGEVIGGSELRTIEPALGPAAEAGFLLPGERWVDPADVVDGLARGLSEAGVEIVTEAAARSIAAFDDGVEVETGAGRFDAETAVVAAGVWSKGLTERLGLRLWLYPGKGYSFSVRTTALPRHALYLSSTHVMAVPMADRMRVAGTMEFDGTTDRFNARRVDAIVRAASPFLDADLAARSQEWVGPRPMTPDGLPYIGRVPGRDRVVVATGHNMLGLTLAPVTGQVVAGLVAHDDPGIDLTPFRLDR